MCFERFSTPGDADRGVDPARRVFGQLAPERRLAGGVNETIDWRAVQRYSRLKPTATSFGWRGKVLLTSPPYLMLAFWAYAGAISSLAGLACSGTILWATGWWTRQVWKKSRIVQIPAPRSAEDDRQRLDPVHERELPIGQRLLRDGEPQVGEAPGQPGVGRP
jgi:hypothetical protein